MRIANPIVPLLCLVVVAAAAPAFGAELLRRGDVVVAGYAYESQPPGACVQRICRVSLDTSDVTPISDLLPDVATIGFVVALAIEDAGTLLAIARRDPVGPSATGTLLEIDVVSGAVEMTADDLVVAPVPELVVTGAGRVFVLGADGVLEIDRVTGVATPFAPAAGASDPYRGLAQLGPDALLAVRTSPVCDPFQGCIDDEFVRIALDTGAATPLGETQASTIRQLAVAPNGDRYSFAPSGLLEDGVIARWSNGQRQTLVGGEAWQDGVTALAIDTDGTLLVGGTGHPEALFGLPEIQRVVPARGAATVRDLDFAVTALAVASRLRACSDGIDNDGDGTIDWDGAGVAAVDVSCGGLAWRNSERDACGLGAELLLVLPLLRRLRA
jgi:hypothetical protein